MLMCGDVVEVSGALSTVLSVLFEFTGLPVGVCGLQVQKGE